MTSAIKLVLGLSVLVFGVTSAACGSDSSSGGSAGTGVIPIGGSGTTGGTGNTTGGTGGTGDPSGIPLTPVMGWIAKESNTLMIQGAMFSFADDSSMVGLMTNVDGPTACISGVAAKVNTMCTPPAGMDCYGVTWGAALGLNLNQPIDMVTMKGADPMPFDASVLTGFAFEVTGAMVPTQANFRFKVENASGEFCSPPAKGVKMGLNTFKFTDLIKECWKAGGMDATTAKSSLLKISWQVVTNATSTVPFDFCISNLVAQE